MPRKFELLRDEITYCRVIPKGDIFEQKADVAVNCSGDCFAIHFLESHPEFFREIKPRKVFVIEIPHEDGYRVNGVILIGDNSKFVETVLVRLEDRDS